LVPTINYEKYTACGKWIDFCHTQSFGFEMKGGKKKTIVKNLNACVVLCRGCEDICPAGAITHLSEERTKQSIAKLQEAALS
jgi:NAD-dependent dihydropyrimidine dehydrogenase PreA subunit